ncbi:MAG: Wzz/FepE/Etk N-terminal domain-containing protein [Candidatus Omnitrophota bacterium]
MQQSPLDEKDFEIDLSAYLRVLAGRKWLFGAVVLLFLAAALVQVAVSPKIYQATMMIEIPVLTPGSTDADAKGAEQLKGLIENGSFDDEVGRRLNLDLHRSGVHFEAENIGSNNLLRVSVRRGAAERQTGAFLLKSLSEVIAESYRNRVEAANLEFDRKIQQNERLIENARNKAENIEGQLKELSVRLERLNAEARSLDADVDELREKRDAVPKGSAKEGSLVIEFAEYLQEAANLRHRIYNQLSDLVISKLNLVFDLKGADFQIRDFQAIIDELKVRKNMISNLKIVSQPKLSPGPVSPRPKKILFLAFILGLFVAIPVVFLREYWGNNIKHA